MNMKKYYVECDCLCFEHVIRLMYDKDKDKDKKDRELYIDYCLKPFLPWYKRLWNVIIYIIYGENEIFWAETAVNKKKVKKIIKFLRGFINDR